MFPLVAGAVGLAGPLLRVLVLLFLLALLGEVLRAAISRQRLVISFFREVTWRATTRFIIISIFLKN